MFNLSDPKHAFLLNEILTSSINAGLQTRNSDFPVYRKDLKDFKNKECMVLEIRKILISYAESFANIGEKQHVEKISSLAQHITEEYRGILHDGIFRIGISQKVLNLFLKYLWCSGWVKQPFHCPFDSIIKNHLIKFDSSIQLTDWTRMSSMDEYSDYVIFAGKLANDSGCSISEWELRVWNQRNVSNQKDADEKSPE